MLWSHEQNGCRLFFPLCVLFLLFSLNLYGGWFDSDWVYRRPVNISSGSSSLPNGYQMELELTTTDLGNPYTNIQTDGADIRFTLADGSTQLDYCFEEWDNTGTSHLLVRLPFSLAASTDTLIYMYYGNPAATDAADPSAVYDYYDDFEDGSLSAFWTWVDIDGYGGTNYDESGGTLTIEAAGDDVYGSHDEYAAVYFEVTDGFLAEVDILSQENTHEWAKCGIMCKNDMSPSGQASALGYQMATLAYSQGFQFFYDSNDNGYMNTRDSDIDEFESTTPSSMRLLKAGDEFSMYIKDGSTWTDWQLVGDTLTRSTANSTQDVGLSVTSHESDELCTVVFDNFSLRKMVENLPTITIETTVDTVSDECVFCKYCWTHYRSIVIEAGSDDVPIGYQIEIDLTTTLMGNPYRCVHYSGGDIRFVSSDSLEMLDYYIEEWDNEGDSKIWVRLADEISAGDADTIIMIYGNPAAYDSSSSADVFEGYDDWDDGSIDAPWSTIDLDGVSGTDIDVTSGRLSIDAGGLNTWQWDSDEYDEYAAVYQKVTGDFIFDVLVYSQDVSNNWSKCGIMCKNDMTSSGGSLGYVYGILTGSEGYLLYYDSDDNGYLDTHPGGGTSSRPQYLRLTKEGTTFRFYSSSDGETWTYRAQRNQTSANSIQDVGLAVCCANEYSGPDYSEAQFDFVRIRKYLDDEPTVTIETTDHAVNDWGDFFFFMGR